MNSASFIGHLFAVAFGSACGICGLILILAGLQVSSLQEWWAGLNLSAITVFVVVGTFFIAFWLWVAIAIIRMAGGFL
jgi:hypothetical protein